MLLGLFVWLLVGSGASTDADVIKAVLTWPLDSPRLSDELRDPTTGFRKIAPKATLGQSVKRVYKTQVQLSPDGKFAVVHLAVQTTIPFCIVALVDIVDRKVLWLGANGEFPAGLVPGVHVSDLMGRETLLFCGGRRQQPSFLGQL